MRKWFICAFWVACGGFTVLALLPGEYLESAALNWWDKAQHASAFFVLGVLGFGAYADTSRRVGLGLLAYGAAIELAQAATGWRSGDWQDWVADAVGLALVWLCFIFVRLRKSSLRLQQLELDTCK